MTSSENHHGIPSLFAKTSKVLRTMFRDVGLGELSEVQIQQRNSKWHVEFDLVPQASADQNSLRTATRDNLPAVPKEVADDRGQQQQNINLQTMTDSPENVRGVKFEDQMLASEAIPKDDVHTDERIVAEQVEFMTEDEHKDSLSKQDDIENFQQNTPAATQQIMRNADFADNVERKEPEMVTDGQTADPLMLSVDENLYSNELPTSTTNTSELQIDIDAQVDEQHTLVGNVLGSGAATDMDDDMDSEYIAKLKKSVAGATEIEKVHDMESAVAERIGPPNRSTSINEQIGDIDEDHTHTTPFSIYSQIAEVDEDVAVQHPSAFKSESRPSKMATARFQESSPKKLRARAASSLPTSTIPVEMFESRRSLRKSHRRYEHKKTADMPTVIENEPSKGALKQDRSLYYFKDFSDHFIDCRSSNRAIQSRQSESLSSTHNTLDPDSKQYIQRENKSMSVNVDGGSHCRYYVLKYCCGNTGTNREDSFYIVNLYDRESIHDLTHGNITNEMRNARNVSDIDQINSKAIRWENIPTGDALTKYFMKSCRYTDSSTQTNSLRYSQNQTQTNVRRYSQNQTQTNVRRYSQNQTQTSISRQFSESKGSRCRSSQVNGSDLRDSASMHPNQNTLRNSGSWSNDNDVNLYVAGETNSYLADKYDFNREYKSNGVTSKTSRCATSPVTHSGHSDRASERTQSLASHNQHNIDTGSIISPIDTTYGPTLVTKSPYGDIEFSRNGNTQHNMYGIQTWCGDRWFNPAMLYPNEYDMLHDNDQLARRCDFMEQLQNTHVLHHLGTVNVQLPARISCDTNNEPTRNLYNADACAHGMNVASSAPPHASHLYERASKVLVQLDEAIKRIRLRKVICTPGPFELQCDTHPNCSNQHTTRACNEASIKEGFKKGTKENMTRRFTPTRLQDICALDAQLNRLRGALNMSSNNVAGPHTDENLNGSDLLMRHYDGMSTNSPPTVSHGLPLPSTMHLVQHTHGEKDFELHREAVEDNRDHDFSRRTKFEIGNMAVCGDDRDNKSQCLQAERLTSDSSPPVLRSIDKIIEGSMYNIQLARETRRATESYRRPPLLSGEVLEYVLRDNRAVALHCGTTDVVYLVRNKDSNRLVTIKFRRACNSSFADISAEADTLGYLQQHSVAGIPHFHGIVLIAKEETRYVKYGLVSSFIGDSDTLRETSLRSLLAERARCAFAITHHVPKYSAAKWKEICVQICLDILATVTGIHERCTISNSITADAVLLEWNGVKRPKVFLQHSNDYEGAYLAPEILQGKPASRASDIYSVARLITSISETMCSPSLAHLVANSLSLNPESRTNGLELFHQLVKFNSKSLMTSVSTSLQLTKETSTVHPQPGSTLQVG